MKQIFYFIVIFMLNPSWILAQCCSGGVPISGSLGLTQYQPKSLQFIMTYDFNTLQALFTGSERLNDDTRERITHSLLLEVDYGLPKGFAIGAMITGVRQERRISTIPGVRDETVNTGLGDAIVLLKYHILRNPNRTTFLGVGVGPKIPTGRNDFEDGRGILLPADLQPGTNAWDAIFWSHFTKTQLLRPTTTFSAMATYRYTSTGKRNRDLQNYRFGNEFIVRAGVSDRLTIGKFLFDPNVSLRFRTVETDLIDGGDFPNTGGTYVFLVPGLGWNVRPELSIQFSGSLPLHRELIGTQVATSYNISASIYYNFAKKAVIANPFF